MAGSQDASRRSSRLEPKYIAFYNSFLFYYTFVLRGQTIAAAPLYEADATTSTPKLTHHGPTTNKIAQETHGVFWARG